MLMSKTELGSKKSRDLIPLKCIHCGETHYRTKSMIFRILHGKLKKTNKGCYCSKKCNYEHKQISKEYKCANCNNIIKRTPSQIKGKYVFCSSSCSATFFNKNRIAWNVCLNCNKKYRPYKGSKWMKYCSRKCSHEHRRKISYQNIENGKYKYTYSGNKIIKDYLIMKVGPKCEQCKNTHWMGRKISLTSHHIDGDASNNLPSNLELLCWNCHAMTDNYGGKNAKSSRTYRYGAEASV